MSGSATGRKRRVISIRWIASGVAVALTAVSVLGVSMFSERNARAALTRELQTRLILEARNLALTSSGALLSEFPELTLTPILSKMMEDEPELTFAVVVDPAGVIRGHADPRRIGEDVHIPSTLRTTESAAGLAENEHVLGDHRMLLASAPVTRRAGGETLGTAYVALDRAYVEEMIDQSRRKQLVLVAVLLAVGTITALVLVSTLLRPVAAIREGLERIGRGDLDTPLRLRDRTELGLLAETMNEMSTRLKAARQEHVEKERLAREVELAREIQSSLIPSSDVRESGCVIDGAHRAAAEVGGDYWDVFPLGDGKIGVAIADVSGKGLAGCLVTSMLAALLRAFRDAETSPSALLIRLEKHLQESLRPGTFITMFYGVLDPGSGTLVFSSAGHCPLLIWRAGGGRADWFRTKGIPIGAVRGGALATTLRDERVQLAPGDIALQYTDGINEAFDIDGQEQFGFERIEAAVESAAASGPKAVLEAVRAGVTKWAGDQPPLDDETLLVIAREAVAKDGSAAPAPGTGPDRADCGRLPEDPLHALRCARASGARLELRADLGALSILHDWLGRSTLLEDLPAGKSSLLESALYEVAANIAEHGLGSDPDRTFELWWLPGPAERPWKEGLFLFVDDGTAFAPEHDAGVDFRKSAVRLRGRGLGLQIIHSAMRSVKYHPRTPAGNITMAVFDPETIRTEEMSHG